MNPYQIKVDRFSSHRQIVRQIRLFFTSGGRILDLGCDTGFLGKLSTTIPSTYTFDGVDINKENLTHANRYYQHTYNFDLNSLDWPIRKHYDIVVIADTLEHLVRPTQVLQNAIKLIKPGGLLIVSIPNCVHWWARILILSGRFPKDERGLFDKTHLHFYTLNTFTNLLKKISRIRLLKVIPTTFPLQFIHGYVSTLKGFYYICYFFALIWPSLFAYQHIFILEVPRLPSTSR